MSNLIFRKLEKTIVGSIAGKPFSMVRTEKAVTFLTDSQKEDTASDVIWEFIQDNRQGEIAESNKYLMFNPLTKEYYLEFDGFRSEKPIPEVLVTMIKESFDKDIDFMPIIKAWARLLSNPRYNDTMGEYFNAYLSTDYVDHVELDRLVEEEEYTEEAARGLCTYPDIAITQEGLLATYKVAELVTWQYEMVMQEDGTYKKERNQKYTPIADKIDPTTGEVLEEGSFEKPPHLEDYLYTPAICKSGDKFFSGDKIGYVYQVGKTQFLPKKAKRNLSNTFGGGGLYIGGLNYVNAYRNDNRHVLTCLVNPGDILSFQSEGHAIRVDALMPNNVWDETIPLKNTYHSSDYDAFSSERLDTLIAEAVHEDVNLAEEQKSYIGDDNTED